MYHCNASPEEPNPWKRLAAVSLQWGNDPSFTQRNFEEEARPTETWNNEDLLKLGRKQTLVNPLPVGVFVAIN